MSTVSKLHSDQRQAAHRQASNLPTLADLVATNRQVTSYAAEQSRAQNLPDLSEPTKLPAGMAEKSRQEALRQRRGLLSSRDAGLAFEAVSDASRGRQDPIVVLALLAQLLDCYAGDKVGNPKTYMEALAFDLSDAGYSNVIIAAACLDLRRTSKFRPSIAEVLDRCRTKHQFVQAVYSGHWRYRQRLQAVHSVLFHTGGDPDMAEIEAHAPIPEEPLLVAEYAKGPGNDWWYDEWLNPDLLFQGDEGPEEWRVRFHQMKAEAEADPEAHRLKIERARGAREGWRIANEYHKRSGLDRRGQAHKEMMRVRDVRHPTREPRDMFVAFATGLIFGFNERFEELEPDYTAQEKARQERNQREAAERGARYRAYQLSQVAKSC